MANGSNGDSQNGGPIDLGRGVDVGAMPGLGGAGGAMVDPVSAMAATGGSGPGLGDFSHTGATLGAILGGLFGPGGSLLGREIGGYGVGAFNTATGLNRGNDPIGISTPNGAPGGAGMNAAAPGAAYGGGGLNLGRGGGMPGISAGPGGFGTLGGGMGGNLPPLGAGSNLGGFGAPGGMGMGTPGMGMGAPTGASNVASLLQSLDPRTLQALAQYFAQMQLLGMGGNVFDPLSGQIGGAQGAMPVGPTGYGQAAYGRTA